MHDESGDSLASLRNMEQRVDAIQGNLEKLLEASKCPAFLNTGSQSTINQSAGGMLGWVCVVLCVAMLAATLAAVGVSSVWAMREFDRRDDQMRDLEHVQRDQQDYLNVIYQQAPQLKPKDKK